MSLTPQELISAQEWNKIIKTNIQAALGAKLDGEFVAVSYPAGFNYAIKQRYYNADTLSTLNLLVNTTDEIPALDGAFSSLYKNVIGNLEYGFSSKDKAMMNQEETEHEALVGTIINQYRESELDDDPVSYPGIMYIMKRIKEVTGADFLQLDTKTYPTLSQLCRNLSEYARLGTYTNKMQNVWDAADNRMNAIQANITTPSEVNGGLKTDAGPWNIGWSKLPETDQILHELQDDKSTISFSLSTDTISESSSTLHFESAVTAEVPFNWFFNMTVQHEHSYDFSKYAKQNAELSITVTFKGITILGAIPEPLSDDNAKGWFAKNILMEAVNKSGKDATGYRLHGSEFDPQDLFGKDGQLKRLKTFVISQQPEIHLAFSKFDCEELNEVFTQNTDVSFSLLGGLINGTHNNDYSFSNYEYNAKKETLEVDIVPPEISESGSISKQTAFILGGVVEAYE